MKQFEKLIDAGYEDVVIFNNPDYDSAIIGVTHDNRAVYDFDKMAEWLAKEEGLTLEDAAEFIEYNTIRSLPYVDNSPVVVYFLEDDDEQES